MTDRTKTGLVILQAAAVLGVFGNIMLRQTPWGINAFLFVTAFVGALFLLTKKRRPELLTVNRLSLMGAMVFFATMFIFRDAIELRVYDTIAILIIMGVLMLGTFGINARIAGVFHYACGFVWAGFNSLLAPFVVLGADLDWKSMPGTRLSRNVFAVLRGAAIALPLLLIFGALFSSADARFEALANQVISFDLENVLSHIAITAILAWLTTGYLRGSIITPGFAAPVPETGDDKTEAAAKDADENSSYFDRAAAEPAEAGVSLPDSATVLEHINRSDPPNAAVDTSKSKTRIRDWQNIDSSSFPGVFTLGVTETVIILGLLDALFLTFVVMQAPYLFGGMELVQNTPDFKLADYARRGFGELVAVAALVLPLLLLSHWLLRRQAKRLETVFRVLAGIQVALVFVIMASAVQRLVLLTGVEGYGLTTVRFYPMVFMLWLAVVFAWFGVTVLRNARQNFAWGALWSAIVILGATNLMNPDAFIARTNIELMKQGRDFDAHYNSQLSTDAFPELISALPEMKFEDQCRVKWELQKRYRDLEEENNDLRSLNLSRRNSFHLLNDNRSQLDSVEGCPPNSVKEVIRAEEID
jgi:hypothetical protein